MQKRKLALVDKYVKDSAGKRQRDVDVRCPEGNSDEDGGECMTLPFLFTCTIGMLGREHQEQLSMNVEMFYKEFSVPKQHYTVCAKSNRYLSDINDYSITYIVSTTINIIHNAYFC